MFSPSKWAWHNSDIALLSQFGLFRDIAAVTFLVSWLVDHQQEHPYFLNLNINLVATRLPVHRATGRFMATVYSGRPQPTTNINEILSKWNIKQALYQQSS